MTARGRLRRILLAWIAGACITTASQPQAQEVGGTVQVRSGNHAQFARLVFVYPDRRAWTLLPTTTGYRLKIDRVSDYALARVFDLIPRTRIADVTASDDGALEIFVACDCHADVIELAGRGLVLDIRDGPAPPGNPFELLRGPEGEATAALEGPAAPDLSAVSVPVPTALRFDPGFGRLADPLHAWAPAGGPLGPDIGPQPVPPTADLVDRGPAAVRDGAVLLAPPSEPLPDQPTDAVASPVPTSSGEGAPQVEQEPEGPPEPAQPAASEQADKPSSDAAPFEAAAVDAEANPAPPGAEPPLGALLAQDTTAAEVPVAALVPPPQRPARPQAAPLADSRPRPGRWIEAPAQTKPAGGPDEARVALPTVVSDTGTAPTMTADAPVAPGRPVQVPQAARDTLLQLLPLRLGDPAPQADARDRELAESFGAVLAEQIGRGLTQGVVEADREALRARMERLRGAEPSTPPGPVAEEVPVAPAAVTPSDPTEQIRIVTAVDRLVTESGARDRAPQAAPTCLPDAEFDIARWLPADEAQPDFGSSRAALVGEFDRVSDAALERAVRYQIAYGFGAEARQLLQTFLPASGLSEERARVLRALSHIVDGESGPETQMLANQINCPSRAALWGALARPVLEPHADYSREAILKAFEELPTGLRRSLGPALAARMLEVGDMTAVAALRRSIARIDVPGDAASEVAREAGTLLDARIEASMGNHAAAEAGLAEVARVDGQLANEAVADLIESVMERGQIPDDPLIATASAMAFEFRGTEIGARLRRGELLALIMREDYNAAQSGLQRAVQRKELPPDRLAEIATRYLDALTSRATDRVFLTRAPVELPNLLAIGAGESARIAAANRLTDLGLPEAALPLVDALRGNAAARAAAARARLRLNDPAAALARLAGLEGDEATRLRAEAYTALGDPGAAADALARIGDARGASEAAWRAGDIDRVADDPQAMRRALASLAAGDPLQAPATPESLAEHQALIEGSSRLRATIAAELARGAVAEPTQ